MVFFYLLYKILSVDQDFCPDTTVLNFLLTLENLENAFYEQGLNTFDAKAFEEAGLPEFARGRFVQLAANERAHQQLLRQFLGENATEPCTYKL
jgi:hypothetical protein